MININEMSKCANCGACYNICPNDAISVCADDLFYYLDVDNLKCIGCGLCVERCPINCKSVENHPICAFAGWHKDTKVVHDSSSGGVFHGIAEKIVASGGIVFGMTFSDDFKELSITSSDEAPLVKLQKSKYVEGLVGTSFRYIKDLLKDGRSVFFCGTPCQVAGLKSYLGREYDNLVTGDFACGGVPSHLLFNQHLTFLRKKHKADVIDVDFRPKTFGWQRYSLLINLSNGKKYQKLANEDDFLKCFLHGKLTVRDYCLDCIFSNHHKSDVTLADFWKYKELSDLRNNQGISLVLCNSEKGKTIIEDISNSYFFEKIDLPQAAYNNIQTITNDNEKRVRLGFLKLCKEKGLRLASRRYLPISFKSKLKSIIIRLFFSNS